MLELKGILKEPAFIVLLVFAIPAILASVYYIFDATRRYRQNVRQQQEEIENYQKEYARWIRKVCPDGHTVHLDAIHWRFAKP